MEVQAPSAAVSVTVMVSDRVQPAHREGGEGLFSWVDSTASRFRREYDPAAISSRYQRSRRCPARAPMATMGSAASVYQVATNSGELSKQWKA